VLHALGEDDEAAGENGAADIAFFGHCSGAFGAGSTAHGRCAILALTDD
jgi:hypothetical protein